MKKKFLIKCLISLGLLLFFTFLPQIMPTPVSIARASEVEKEKNNEYRLNLRTITLVNGKSFTLRVYNLEKDARVTFKSADPEIASVNDDGTITANKVGTTTITATVRLGLNTTPLICEVTIGPPAFSVKLTRPMIVLELDQVFQLEAVMKPTNTAELVKYSSLDPTIASVSSGGRVTARKTGMTYVFAEIDATNQDGSRKFSSCSVIVGSSDEAAQINEYFALHPELSLLTEAERSNALYDFFNKDMALADNTRMSVVTTNTLDTKSSASTTDSASKEPRPTPSASTNLQANSDTSASTTKNSLSLIESLEKHMNTRFNMVELKQKYDVRFQMISEIQLSSIYVFGDMIRR